MVLARAKLQPSARRGPLVAALALVVMVGCVFGQTLTFSLLSWDDNYNVAENPRLHPVSLSHVASFWQAPYLGLYVPLSYTLFSLEAAIAELPPLRDNPRALATICHAGNLLLHALCALVVFQLLARLVRHRPAALVGAALFAVHPLQVESVAWVTEARGLLGTLFVLSALWIYGREIEIASNFPARPKWPSVALCLLCIAAALLSKPAAAAAPGMLLMLGVWRRDDRRRLALLVGLSAAMALAALLVSNNLQPSDALAEHMPIYARPVVALASVGFYVLKTLAPWSLGPDYGWRPTLLLHDASYYAIGLVPLGIAGLVWKFQSLRPAAIGLAFFLAGLLPTLGFVPFGFQQVSTVADRYTYLAIFGICLVAAQSLARDWSFRTATMAAVVVVLLAACSFFQARHWRDDRALFARMLEINPRSFVAYTNLGVRADRLGNRSRAMDLYRRALELNPAYAITWFNLGSAQLKTGDYQAASTSLRRSLDLAPDKVETLTNLGRALVELRQPAEAVPLLAKAVKLDPRCPQSLATLGDAQMQLGRFDEAARDFRRAIELSHSSVEPYYLLAELCRRRWRLTEARRWLQQAAVIDPRSAAVRYALGEVAALVEDWPLAETCFAQAIQLNPRLVQARYQLACVLLHRDRTERAVVMLEQLRLQFPRYPDSYIGLAQAAILRGDATTAIVRCREALRVRPAWPTARRWLAWALATNPDAAHRDGSQALSIARELAANKAPSAEILDLLAAAHAELGQYDEARRLAAQAAQLAAAREQPALCGRIEARRALYERQAPYRSTPAVSRVAARPGD